MVPVACASVRQCRMSNRAIAIVMSDIPILAAAVRAETAPQGHDGFLGEETPQNGDQELSD